MRNYTLESEETELQLLRFYTPAVMQNKPKCETKVPRYKTENEHKQHRTKCLSAI